MTALRGYRAPFGYRMLRLVSLLAMTASQFAMVILGLSQMYGRLRLDDPFAPWLGVAAAMELFGQVSVPLLLISAMTTVLRKPQSIGKVLVTFFLGGMALATVYAALYQAVIESIGSFTVAALPTLADRLP